MTGACVRASATCFVLRRNVSHWTPACIALNGLWVSDRLKCTILCHLISSGMQPVWLKADERDPARDASLQRVGKVKKLTLKLKLLRRDNSPWKSASEAAWPEGCPEAGDLQYYYIIIYNIYIYIYIYIYTIIIHIIISSDTLSSRQ